MQKYPAISIVLLFGLVFCFSCKSKTTDIYKDIDNTSSQAKRFEIKIPVYKSGTQKGEVNWIYGYIKKQTLDLGLDTLQSGYKDIQIRIWLHSWLAIKNDLVILSRTNHQWTGELITMTYKYNDSLQEHLIVKKESKQIAPKSG